MPPITCMERLATSWHDSVTNFFVSETSRRSLPGSMPAAAARAVAGGIARVAESTLAASADPPEHVLLRHLHVAEGDAARASAAATHQAVEIFRLHSRPAVDDEAGDRLVRLRGRIGAGVDEKIVGRRGPA